MNKTLYTLTLLLLGAVILNAQDDYKMFLSILLKPNLDQVSAFEENLAAHN